MRAEIERKFLVSGDGWREAAGDGVPCCPGYISSDPAGATVRVRLLGGRGYLTVKGPAQGFSRPELEYEIPAADAEYMIENLCGGRVISKRRHTLESGGMHWEIDEFLGTNEGLVLAEIELEREDQPFRRPDWLGREVSHEGCYTNAALAGQPFREWK